MSASPPKADISRQTSPRPLCARSGHHAVSFDYFVGQLLKRVRYFQPERLGGLQVDDKLELGRLHDRKLAWLGAVQDTADVYPHLTKRLEAVGGIASQTASPDELGPLVNRRDAMARCKRDDLILLHLKERIATHHQSMHALLHEAGEGLIDFARLGGVQYKKLQGHAACRGLSLSQL